MKKHLLDYIKIYRNAIDENTRLESLKILENVKWGGHQFYDVRKQESYYTEDDLMSYYNRIETCPQLMDTTWKCLKQYVLEDMNFHWMAGWEDFNILKFNRYQPGGQLKDHCDHIRDIFDGNKKGIPILTVIGLFNDDFKGGEFVLCEDEVQDLRAGDVIIFPSLFMYPHRVNKLVEGTRYSYATWAW